MAKFELVKGQTDTSLLPTRATDGSAGYDFKVAEEIILPPHYFMEDAMKNYRSVKSFLDLQDVKQITSAHSLRPRLVRTGVKCKLDPGTFLQISVRSSCPLNYWIILANGVGIIDADYYGNASNDGEILFQLINLSPYYIKLYPGDKIGQGVILKYETTEDDILVPKKERAGGFGSTNV